MGESGGEFEITSQDSVLQKPQWKKTADEIRKETGERIKQELLNRAKEQLSQAGIVEAGLLLAQQLATTHTGRVHENLVRLEIGYDRNFIPALIIRAHPEPVQLKNGEFVGWKSKGIRVQLNPLTSMCSIQEISNDKDQWKEIKKRGTARYSMNNDQRTLAIDEVYESMKRVFVGSTSYFELGRQKDMRIVSASEKRFKAVTITGKNAGNFVQ